MAADEDQAKQVVADGRVVDLRVEIRGGPLVKVQVGPRTIYRQRKGGASMFATNDGRVLVGLGKAAKVDKITLRWPSGTVQTLEDVKPGQTLKVVEPAEGSK